MPERKPTPEERLERMKKSFDEDYSMLTEDYDFFINDPAVKQRASTSPSRAAHTSAAPRARKSPRRS